MPRKRLFTREEITEAALALTRERGFAAVTARALGERLGVSSKPVFSVFRNMEEVQAAVLAAANERYEAYIAHDMAEGRYPPYKASGMAYIRFAREEKELFRLLFMRDRSHEEKGAMQADALIAMICERSGASEAEARAFHLEMWVFVHGIAAMTATSYLDFSEEEASAMLSDIYLSRMEQLMKKKEGTTDGNA